MTTQHLIAALTYDGSLLHSAINYFLIAISVLALARMPSRSQRWLICALVAVIVQVLLWVMADAEGVSIIWSMLAGALLWEWLRHRQRGLVGVALVCDAAGLVFYLLSLPLITTIAHSLGVLLGLGIHAAVRRR